MSTDALCKRFWWPSWACGLLLSWIAFFFATATISRIMDDAATENLAIFATAITVPLLLTSAVPAAWALVGLYDLIAVASHRRASMTAPSAFTLSLIVGAAASFVLHPVPGEIFAGVAIFFALGQLSAGIYLPFSITLLASWMSARVKSRIATGALLVISIISLTLGSAFGFTLGAFGA